MIDANTLKKRFQAAQDEVEAAENHLSAVNRGIGTDLRTEREARGIQGKRVANALGCSHPYLLDLEKGKRKWNLAKIDRYVQCLKEGSEKGWKSQLESVSRLQARFREKAKIAGEMRDDAESKNNDIAANEYSGERAIYLEAAMECGLELERVEGGLK